jgi:hypothetical protein
MGTSFVAVPFGVLLNNSRLNDLKDALGHSINETKETLRAESRAELAQLRMLMERNHSELLARLGDIDSRLTRIEPERRIVQ